MLRKYKLIGVRCLIVSLGWLLASSASHALSLNLELWELTGGANPFPRNVYLCALCTPEQFAAVPLPGPNWQKNVSDDDARLFLPDSATNTPPVPDPGVATALDLVVELPGDDHFLVAQVLSGSLLGNGAQGLMAAVQVARGTTMTYLAGRVIHKITSGMGVDYILFTMSLDKTAEFDPTVLNGLAGMSVPTGWSYSSEVLTEDLNITTDNGVASVFNVPDYWGFQQIILVPEPGTGLLLAVGLLGLRARRRAPGPAPVASKRRG